MKLLWKIEASDVRRVKAFYDEQKNNDFVVWRYSRNIEGDIPDVSHAVFWTAMVSCLLTTQQRAGPDSAVSRFNGTKPFPLNYTRCKQQRSLKKFAERTLATYGGIRRSPTLAEEIQENFQRLENGGWHEVDETIAELERNPTLQAEIEAADFIDYSLKGFGPKQSRNLLQGLGLTKYEIPIDSRITKWLNDFGFPIKLSAASLGDINYYRFVSEGFQQLCEACDIYPCLLDAAIFSSYD
jgi:hypothetical protein